LLFDDLLEQQFELCKRMKHVLSEANRVLTFKQVCDSNTSDRLETLGELMNQSHNSCAKLYECSSEQLDELTDICRSVYVHFSVKEKINFPFFFQAKRCTWFTSDGCWLGWLCCFTCPTRKS
jgi:hypothetical protein